MSKGKYIEEFPRLTNAHSTPFKSAEELFENYNKRITRYLRENYESKRRLAEKNYAGSRSGENESQN